MSERPAPERQEPRQHMGAVLPYRCEGDDLVRLIEARARGWALPQVRSLNFSPKNFEGTLLTAQVLGFLQGESGELTEEGRALALAAPDDRPELLLGVFERFEPYGLLLEAIFAGEHPGATQVDWVERWWSAHGYGSSQSNRSEAATVFARLTDFVGLGSYIQGRRGHPSRIEWHRAPRELPRARRQARPEPTSIQQPPSPPPPPPDAASTSPPDRSPPHDTLPSPGHQQAEAYSSVTLELRAGRLAQFRVPSTLTRAEKERLLSVVDLLITIVPGE